MGREAHFPWLRGNASLFLLHTATITDYSLLTFHQLYLAYEALKFDSGGIFL